MISTIGSPGVITNTPPQERQQQFRPPQFGTNRPSIQSSRLELKPDNRARNRNIGIVAGVTGGLGVTVGSGVGIAALQAKQREEDTKKLAGVSSEAEAQGTHSDGDGEYVDPGSDTKDEETVSLKESTSDQIAKMETADVSAKLIEINEASGFKFTDLSLDNKVAIFNNIKKNLSEFEQEGLKVITGEIQSATEQSDFVQKQIDALKATKKNNTSDPEAAAVTDAKLAKYEVLLANLKSDLVTLKHDKGIMVKNFEALKGDVNARGSEVGKKNEVLDQSLLLNFIKFIQPSRTNIDKELSKIEVPKEGGI